MQAFVAVGETGSFTTAAARLKVARALVSKRVAKLERTMGVRLLNRTTRRVGLTEPGQAFLGRAQRILAEFERASAELTNLHGEPAGTLNVSAPMSFGIKHLAPLLPGFMRTYPSLKINLVLNDRQVDLIDDGFDLAVRIGRLADSSLVARRLATVRMILCASPAYLAAAGRLERPADLAHHKGLIYGQGIAVTRWTLTRGKETVVVEPMPQMTANNGDMLLAAAIAGEGIVMQPTFLAGDALRAGDVVRVLKDYSPGTFNLYAVWPANRLLPAKVRLFVDYLGRQIGDPPAWDAGLDEIDAIGSG
ncbi:LysR family transcriptional regulator [Arboricoccus pini]|nr:LysR family transcriptional regulator [Arboricoccus pini]